MTDHGKPRAIHARAHALAAMILAAALLGGCGRRPDPVASGPSFSAIRFFDGRSEGSATLKVLFKAPTHVAVRSKGHVEPGGTLVLDQRIEEAGKAPRDRQWRIREVAPGRYAGSLTDADGPVTGETEGNRLHLAFRMKAGGFPTEQWLSLSPDGRAAHNILVVRKFGIAIAVLEETIRKAG